MKVIEAIKRAAALTGRPEMPCFENTAGNLKKLLPVLNTVLSELETGICVSSPEQTLPLSSESGNALCYGLAAYVARTVGDSDSYGYLIKMYSAYRCKVLSKNTAIKDVLPRVY